MGVVALPLALAFGISSGLDASAGIITAIVAGFVAAVFGGSNVQVSGPTGAMAVILAPIVASHGAGAVVVISILAGVVLIAAGVMRLGRVVVYIPWPVIEGFTAGIAIIIALQQVPLALDGHAPAGEAPLASALAVVREADWQQTWKPLAVTIAVIAVVEALRRWVPRAPGPLVAVALATAFVAFTGLDVERIGELPSTLPAPSLPAMPLETVRSLVGPALAVAALAAIESLLSARVAAGMDPRTGRVLPDREVVGQGLASIASGLFGGMPATGAIARTAVNVRAGARSRLASMTHAVFLALVIAAGAGLAGQIPLAALAGVLISTTMHMVKPAEVRMLLRVSRSAAATFVITIACTVLLDLITAVEVGIALAAFFALRALARTSHVQRDTLPGAAVAGDERIALLTLSGSLFFGAADRIMDKIADSEAAVVILRLSALGLMDPTGAKRLGEVVTQLEARGVTVLIKGLRPEHTLVASRTGMIESLAHAAHRFDTLDDAVAHAREHVARAA
ncbi:SulP family inorganic anion transporter [Salana multivorans]